MENTLAEPAFKEIFDGLLGAQEAEAARRYQAIAADVDEQCLNNPDTFYFQLQYPYEQFLDGLLAAGLPNPADKGRLYFLFQHSQFVDHHLEKLFERFEGRASCCDKASVCIQALMGFFKTGKEIVFNYNQKYTFHLPAKIFRTHESLYGFFEGLRQLYYGDPRTYLVKLAELTDAEAAN